ncbi:MAG: LemA family protein [Christensenellales bacterium]|jgi:LemA protein
MRKGAWITLGVIAVVLILIVGSVVGIYNGMVSAQESVDNAMSAIDVQLKRRTDLVPNLVNTVKGFAAHETEIIDSVTEARAQLAGARTVEEKAQADNALSGALSRLLVVVENYPDLKSNANFQQLSDELAGTENRIAVARQDYNNAVKAYNANIRRFPNKLFAGMFGFSQAQYFEGSEADQQAPEVDFGA